MTQELAFPGTDDTRSIVEVSDYIKSQNAEFAAPQPAVDQSVTTSSRLEAAQPAVPDEIESLVRDIHKAVKRGEGTQDHGLLMNLRCILDHVLADPPDMTAQPAVPKPLTEPEPEA